MQRSTEQVSYQICLKNVKINKIYICLDMISSGSYCEQYNGLIAKQKSPITIEFFNLAHLQQKYTFRNKEMIKRLSKAQIDVMKKINHPNILKCLKVTQNSKHKINIFEKCRGGSLFALVQQTTLSQIDCISILKQIILALSQLHKLKIIVTSLNPQYILINNGIVKLRDFGFEDLANEDQDFNQSYRQKQYQLKASEIVQKSSYTLKAQTWSLALLLYFMIYGNFPPQTLKKTQAYQDIKLKQKQQFKQAIGLLKKYLHFDPKNRPNWNQFIRQQIFTKFKNQTTSPLIFDFDISGCSLDNQTIQLKRNYQLQKKSFISELEKPYIKQQGELVLIPIQQKSDIEQFKKSINKKEQQQFIALELLNLQYAKTLWVYYNLLNTFESLKIDQDDRTVVQLKFLITWRCYSNILLIYEQIKKIQDKPNKIYSITRNIYQLKNELIKKFEKSTAQITQKQDSIFSIFGDRLKKTFQKETYLMKQKFLVGIQNIDYQKQEQIQFTYSYYFQNVDKIIGQSIKQKKGYKTNNQLNFRENMRIFKEVLQITFKQLKNKKTNFHTKIFQLKNKLQKSSQGTK